MFSFFLFLLFLLAYQIDVSVFASSVSLAHSLVKIRPDRGFSGKETISMFACRNEYESLQVVLDGPLDNVSVSVEVPWPCPRSPCYVIYRAEYINITEVSDCYGDLGLWPDPLIPHTDIFYNEQRDGFPINIPGKENRVIWIDLFVPPATTPGMFKGKITVTSPSLPKPVMFPYSVTVWKGTLPAVSSFVTEFDFLSTEAVKVHYGQPGNATVMLLLTQLYLQAAMMNRITLGNFLSSDEAIHSSHPIDWKSVEKHWEPFLSGINLPFGLQESVVTSIGVPTPFCHDFSTAEAQPCNETQKCQQVYYWREVYEYFHKKGLSSRLYDYTFDEPHSQQEWQSVRNRASYVREANSNLRTVVTTEMDKALWAGVVDLIDVFVPVINFVDAKPGCYAQNQRQSYNSCKYLWWYQSCMSDGCDGGCHPNRTGHCLTDWPSYMIDHSAIKNRVMSWMSYLYDMQGELYWGTNAFDKVGDAWQNSFLAGGNGDGTLFYPGIPTKIGGMSHIPIESIRMKQIRDGLEDMEMFRLLEKQSGSREAVLELMKPVVQRAFQFTDNPDVMLAARQAIGAKLMG